MADVVKQFLQELEAGRFTKVEVADKSGISRQSFTNWMTGRGSPTVANMEAALNSIGYELVIRRVKND